MSDKRVSHFYQRGFALLDVFLAVIILTIISVGSYELIGSYRNASIAQTVESDIMNIAQSYSPILNQTAIVNTSQNPFIQPGNSGKMLVSFLRGVPIPNSRIDTASDLYSYVKTNLTLSNGNANLGFAALTTKSDSGYPAQQYFIAGVKARYSQAIQLIQAMNNSFGVFLGNADASFSASGNVNTLPSCPNKNCVYNLYFVSPKMDDSTVFTGDFSAP